MIYAIHLFVLVVSFLILLRIKFRNIAFQIQQEKSATVTDIDSGRHSHPPSSLNLSAATHKVLSDYVITPRVVLQFLGQKTRSLLKSGEKLELIFVSELSDWLFCVCVYHCYNRRKCIASKPGLTILSTLALCIITAAKTYLSAKYSG